jgi:fimbrial chaperone protein
LPVAVHLVPGQTATTIEVTNRGGVAAAIQLRAFAWSQDGDKDLLTPTQDIILSPPIFTLAKDGKQTIRLMIRRGAHAAGERTYRLLIDEVPPVNAKDQQVAIAMRLSLPVIIASAAPTPGALQWRARRGADGQVTLIATNTGRAFERVQSIAVKLADGSDHAVAASGANNYILPGAQRQWVVKTASGAARELRLMVSARSGKSEQVVVLAP